MSKKEFTPKNGKAFRGSKKPSFIEKKEETVDFKTKANDPSWYAKDPALLRDAASLSFYEPLGSTRYLYSKADFADDRVACGGMILGFAPAVGSSFETALATSPINLAAQKLFSDIRAKISGSRPYEPNDVMMYVVSVSDLYGWVSALMRLYSLLRTYKLFNWYFAKIYVDALGFDFDDLIGHITDLRFYINKVVHNLGAYAVPAGLSVVARRCWMNLSIFADRPIKKAQLYFYKQLGFYKYDNENAKVDVVSTKGVSTFAQIIEYTENLLSGLRNVEDIGTMSGDILRAFGESGILTMQPIPEDFHVEIVYSEEVLNQIHNTIVAPCVQGLDTTSGSVEDNLKRLGLGENGVLIEYNSANGKPCLVLQNLGRRFDNYMDDYIDLIDDDSSPERIMVATRNMAFFKVLEYGELTDESGLYEVVGCGTEIFLSETIVCMDSELGIKLLAEYSTFMDRTAVGTSLRTWSMYSRANTQFAHAPRWYVNYKANSGNIGYILPVRIDLNNYAKIEARDLDNISHAAVISEFTV